MFGCCPTYTHIHSLTDANKTINQKNSKSTHKQCMHSVKFSGEMVEKLLYRERRNKKMSDTDLCGMIIYVYCSQKHLVLSLIINLEIIPQCGLSQVNTAIKVNVFMNTIEFSFVGVLFIVCFFL